MKYVCLGYFDEARWERLQESERNAIMDRRGLLFGSGLLLRSFVALKNVDPGYVAKDIFTFQMAPEQAQLNSAQAWATFHLAFMDRLRALPGVETVGSVENFPLDEAYSTMGFTPAPTAAWRTQT